MKRYLSAANPKKTAALLLAVLLSIVLASGGLAPVHAATTVKISKKTATLTVGSSLALKVTGTKAKITWKSSNKAIASVTKTGKVTAKKVGKTTIKASYKSGKKVKTLSCVITVKAKPAPPVPPTKAIISGASVKLPSNETDWIVNYIIAALPAGSTGYSFKINGQAIAATPVFSDGSLVKIAVPAGVTTAKVEATKGGVAAGSANITFASAGLAAPKAFYGTVSMKFSEYFHSITADAALPTTAAFPKSGEVAKPKLFITQGTRSGNVVGGVDTPTYAEAEASGLPYVDAVSTATYGDSVHFVPDANLTLKGDRLINTDPNKAITGITSVEVGADYNLYANAAILKRAGKATDYSRNVFSKLTGSFNLLNIVKADGKVTDASAKAVSGAEIYKAKMMLTDGNWGNRILVNDAAAKKLPGAGNASEAEDVAYGGNWGDKVTGFSFGDAAALGADYAGEKYWDNFANNIYGGIITDSTGHSEPLVFLQNLFTHRFHEDFDIALSPTRFSRLKELKSPDTYTVTVFADGFKDITFKYSAKNYINAQAQMDGSVTATVPAEEKTLTVKGLDNSALYVSGAKLMKGTAQVPASQYTLTANGRTAAKLTLKTSFFSGSYQGAYSLSYDTAYCTAKPLSFTVINPAVIKLALTETGDAEDAGYSEAAPLVVSKASQAAVYLTGDSAAVDFAKSLVTVGRAGFSTIQTIDPTPATSAVAVGTAVARADANSPYRIDISAGSFEADKTYKLSLVAPGFNSQIFYIKVTA